MKYLSEIFIKSSSLTVRAFLWVVLGASIYVLIENEALKTDLSTEATTLINEMELDEEKESGMEYTATITASHSHLLMGKGVGNVKIYSRKPVGEGGYEYYMLSYFYEQEFNEWTNLATFGYEDIDARDDAVKAFAQNS